MNNKINFLEHINVNEFSGTFEVSKVIFDILQGQEDPILWKKSYDSFVLFSREGREIFVEEIKNSSGFSDMQFEYNRDARKIIRYLYSRAQPVVLRRSNTLLLHKNTNLRKFLEGKDFSVSFCV